MFRDKQISDLILFPICVWLVCDKFVADGLLMASLLALVFIVAKCLGNSLARYAEEKLEDEGGY